MIRNLFAASVLTFSASVLAAPQWTQVATGDPTPVYLDGNSVADVGSFRSLRVMRDYGASIDLGVSPETNTPMYVHRSVTLTYLADCTKGKIALHAWEMFSGSSGQGDLVWADRFRGKPAFVEPGSNEEGSALTTTCEKSSGPVAGLSE